VPQLPPAGQGPDDTDELDDDADDDELF